MPQKEINGTKIFYEVRGSGFPAVFTHGLGGDHTMWVNQVPEFEKKYRTVVWDVRGHGRTEVTENGYSIARFTDDLKKLLDFLAIKRAHIIGLSMGGWISWSFALEHPETVEALVLSDSAGMQAAAPKEQNEQRRQMFEASAHIAEKYGRERLADTTVSLMFAREFIESRPELVELIKKRICQSPGVGYARTVRGLFASDEHETPQQTKKRLSQIKAPTLVLAGEKDQLTPMPTQEALAKAIPGARLEKIPGSGHVPPIEMPEVWNGLVLDFLRGIKA